MPTDFFLRLASRHFNKESGQSATEDKISFEKAKECHKAYLQNEHFRIKLPPPTGTNPQLYWKGYRISKGAVQQLLTYDVVELFVYFAIHPDDIKNKVVKEHQRVTLVFSPIIPDPDDPTNPEGMIKESVDSIEYVDPCPTKCPKNLKFLS